MSNSATSIFNLLIVGEKTRIAHLKKFASELEKLHVKCMVINDLEYINKSTEINLLKKSQKNKKIKELLKNFKPKIDHQKSIFCYWCSVWDECSAKTDKNPSFKNYLKVIPEK